MVHPQLEDCWGALELREGLWSLPCPQPPGKRKQKKENLLQSLPSLQALGTSLISSCTEDNRRQRATVW